jgi:hypothetical protein
MPKIKTSGGLTVAILSCLAGKKEAITVPDLTELITNAGRKTTVAEVSSLMNSIMNSKVRELLEVGKLGRSHTYLLKEDYRKANTDQLQKVYMKRVKYTPEDLHKDLHGTPEEVPSQESAGDRQEVMVKGNKIILVIPRGETVSVEILYSN